MSIAEKKAKLKDSNLYATFFEIFAFLYQGLQLPLILTCCFLLRTNPREYNYRNFRIVKRFQHFLFMGVINSSGRGSTGIKIWTTSSSVFCTSEER